MNSKIVGFTISRNEIDHNDIDVFDSNLQIKGKKCCNLFFYYWGIHNIDECVVENNLFSLGFPPTDSLLDRNALIRVNDDYIEIENDWLGSIPIFYNSESGTVSTLFNKTLETDSVEIDPEGFNYFLEFGFSVFESTPIKKIRFLRYYSKLRVDVNTIDVEYKNDPAINYDKTTTEEKLWQNIENYLSKVEQYVKGDIIIPTSGGYDSRILNYFIKNKERIRAYTYGISEKQNTSFEVVYAKKLAKILGIQWKFIPLGEFFRYYLDWFRLYGCSTHLHGMYHIEFYKKMNLESDSTLLSGIVGDAWSGKIDVGTIVSSQKIINLAYTHGMTANRQKSNLHSNDDNRITFFNENIDNLNNPNLQPIFLVRLKIILLSYLLTIPEYLGWPTWTPYLNFDIVMGMLNLPEERRTNRLWQKDFFHQKGINIEDFGLKCDRDNTLNFQAYSRYIFPELDEGILSEYYNKNEIKSINANLFGIRSISNKIQYQALHIRYIKIFTRIIGFRDNITKNLNALYVLKALELCLK